MKPTIYKPGLGWKHLGGPVWEHCCGWRAHVGGICGLPVEPIVDGNMWPESRSLDRFIAINGGNRKRGVMTWAMHVYRERYEASGVYP